jgi:hypothetical protein
LSSFFSKWNTAACLYSEIICLHSSTDGTLGDRLLSCRNGDNRTCI